MKVYIHTFGCQMNEYDSERMAGVLELAGHEIVYSEGEADAIIINTCTVRNLAEEKAYSYAGRFVTDKKVIITGCLAEIKKEELIKKFPTLHAVVGTYNFANIGKVITAGKGKVLFGAAEEGYGKDVKRPGGVSGYLAIMQGCDNFCSYCIVPYARGRERSRSLDGIIAEMHKMASDGFVEVILLGQNVNSYKDSKTGVNFSGLLKEAARVDGIERIRFMTSHPKDLSRELVETVGALDKVCNHIHLAVQSGSDRVLKNMNRKYTRQQFLDKLEMIREIIPGVCITTDVMVGFPGETQSDFEDTVSLLEKARFDSAYMFKYSPRQGTEAFKMKDGTDKDEKARRINYVLELQKHISENINSAEIGKEIKALGIIAADRYKGEIEATLESGKKVFCPGDKSLIGKIFKVKITGLKGMSFSGETVK
ncbi:MAG: tRNA (N6-isopentenyl adenosine(37)-C2)-methylthiotransferase MiaB [Candidatus Goldbacteria bacterium]|nr:tRNA (N6-isopentenyl adenosine(37)-C2)-methylthiotransferase MiaB [Candidatus Goldiibacteriota bacterium]